MFPQTSKTETFNLLSANPTKWSNTLKRFVGNMPTNCLRVFDNFVGLALKQLTRLRLGLCHLLDHDSKRNLQIPLMLSIVVSPILKRLLLFFFPFQTFFEERTTLLSEFFAISSSIN